MSLQLAWSHSIVTKFFFTHKTFKNRTWCITTPEKAERNNYHHIADTLLLFSFSGPLLSLFVLALLGEIYLIMDLSMMQIDERNQE
jgi:hypothetical protein